MERNVIILIGEKETPVRVPTLALVRLSQKFRDHVLQFLPLKPFQVDADAREDGNSGFAIVWKSMNEETFRRLGEYQNCRRYSVQDITSGDLKKHEAFKERQEFASHMAPGNTVLKLALQIGQEKEYRQNARIRLFFLDLHDKFKGYLSPTLGPLTGDPARLVAHAELYVLGKRFEISGLREKAAMHLMVMLLGLEITFDFAGQFALLARFVYENLDEHDYLRVMVSRVGTIAVNIFR
ncbi:hypothetical protein F4781DRAFT_102211 [Annulohypoxylon bovei var. microspora]|nr:hypothetical protein F4781DRAFT_102211 [Annulohypoxylon bovei var. microspora]